MLGLRLEPDRREQRQRKPGYTNPESFPELGVSLRAVFPRASWGTDARRNKGVFFVKRNLATLRSRRSCESEQRLLDIK